MHPDAALPTFRLPPGLSLAQASPWHTVPVTLQSPALDVMTDLTQVKAATIRPDATLQQAEQTMIYQGVRMLFVVSEMPELEGLITAAVSSSDHGYLKPHPSIFEAALELAGVEAAESMMVGDSFMHDIEGARRVGMRGVLVHRAGEPPAHVADVPVIRDLSELHALL